MYQDYKSVMTLPSIIVIAYEISMKKVKFIYLKMKNIYSIRIYGEPMSQQSLEQDLILISPETIKNIDSELWYNYRSYYSVRGRIHRWPGGGWSLRFAICRHAGCDGPANPC